MNRLEFVEPGIFDKLKIKSGVSKANQLNFPPYGFSVLKAELWNEEEIKTNRAILADSIGIEPVRLIFNKQIHSDIINIADAKMKNREGDAIVTNRQGVAIGVSIADCAGILLHDPVNNVVAAVHSGWRGTSLRILTKTLKVLKENYNSDMESVKAFISPCAGGASYEVGEEVAELFPESCIKSSNGKYLFENKNELRNEMLDSGMNPKNLEISAIDTITDRNYHSYRRDKKYSGRMGAFIMMV